MNEHTKLPPQSIVQESPPHNALAGGQYFEEGINLNQVFQSGLHKQTAGEKKSLSIVRSDKLPFVCGDRAQFVQLMELIIEMIVSYPPADSKLFLYVKCVGEEKDAEVMDLRLTEGAQLYTLHFYTNITTDNAWKMICKDRITGCEVIARQNKGCFTFYPISNTGCIFSLTLPGKIN